MRDRHKKINRIALTQSLTILSVCSHWNPDLHLLVLWGLGEGKGQIILRNAKWQFTTYLCYKINSINVVNLSLSVSDTGDNKPITRTRWVYSRI